MSAPQTVPAPAVLVVDDEPIVLCLMERILGSAGFQVRSAADGFAALASVAEAPPDILVTDIRMDPINGVDLATMVLRQRPAIRVLFVSGYDAEQLALNGHLLRKPFSPDQLVQAVHRLLGHSIDRPATLGLAR